MNKYLYTFILFTIWSSPKLLFSQDINLRDNYFSNCLYNVNPAAAGYKGGFISTASYSKEWLGLKDAPSIQVFSNSVRLGSEKFYDDKYFISKPLFDFAPRVGIGVSLYNETSGPLRQTGILFAYAYHIPIKGKRLSFGLSGLYSQFNVNNNLFNPINNDDPKLYENNSGGIPSFQIGTMFYGKNLILSCSMLHSINKNEDYQSDADFNINAFSVYKFNLNRLYTLEPSIMYDYTNNNESNIDFNLRLLYLKKYWLLASLREFNSISAGIGIAIKPNIHFQYTYKASNSILSNYSNGCHNIGILLNTEKIIQNK